MLKNGKSHCQRTTLTVLCGVFFCGGFSYFNARAGKFPPDTNLQGHRRCMLGVPPPKMIVIGLKKYKQMVAVKPNWLKLSVEMGLAMQDYVAWFQTHRLYFISNYFRYFFTVSFLTGLGTAPTHPGGKKHK